MQPTRFLALALLAVLSVHEVIAAPKLTPGVYKIESVIKGNTPIGVHQTLPEIQLVHFNGPVATWKVRKEGDKSYLLSVGDYPYTGVVDDKVTASKRPQQNVEWLVNYKQLQDAYTIEPANTPGRGWTRSSGDRAAEISIKHILVQPSEPPRYSPDQLWRFVPYKE